jgi:hypothetical protein
MTGKHFVFAMGLLALTAGAHAQEGCKGGAKSEWKKPEEAEKAAIQLNHTKIVKVIVENGCYEVVTINSDGKIVGVQFDPVTLQLHKIEAPR